MVKKRLVVFGILFIILFSLAKAEEDISTSPTLDRYNSFLIACKGCDGASLGDEMVCNSPNSGYDPDRETGCAFLHEGDSVEFPDKADPDECSSALKNGFGSSITRPSGQGCWVFVAEEDAGEDDCAYLLPIEGTIINGVNPTNLFYVNPTIYDILSFQSDDLFEDWSWGAAEDSKDMIVYYDWILDVSESYICADGGYWDRCFSSDAGHPDGNIGVKTWVDGLLYECVEEENSVPTWSVLGQDLDHDSYTSDIDCIDSPSQLPSSITIPDDCPTTETIDDCYQLKYSTCPLCINPSAPEVCGDGINNDCRGDDGVDGAMTFSTADDLDGKTPDDCDLFKEGCEQKTFENVADSQTEEGEEQTPVQHRNVDDGYYSWIDTLEGG
ncbi:MAG TPA: hypothetical protein VJI15_04670, partial [Candidatus Nanoarchaeia archaeon]|nr:hypothetical protein [Candidatus Nanoarchaeia archaeon]